MIVTKPSYEIRQALHERYEKRIASAQEDKSEAKSQGDLSENFGYTEARKDVENLRRMQAELGFKTPGIQLVDPSEWTQLDMDGSPRAMIGAKLRIQRGAKEETVLIGGAWDSDLNNPQIIPYTSPLGKALIPKPPGFKTTLGEETITILEAAAPTEKDIRKFYEPAPEKKKPDPGPEMS